MGDIITDHDFILFSFLKEFSCFQFLVFVLQLHDKNVHTGKCDIGLFPIIISQSCSRQLAAYIPDTLCSFHISDIPVREILTSRTTPTK